MLEILKFVFSSVWIWLGTVVLISIPFQALVWIAGSIFGSREKASEKDKPK